ncbi:uncharacterized protein BT62DRAFT_590145 [Guyanagaster necrorhizus]|uniref:Uncharacterized protein n=1 Tax=Guyanagaster necrorhizus TaxID=856835 RepID=A0A9P7VYH8_9AGAR|nr:uncharacterized protein BT62DRAFT_590145 [Guyanagaster necrorhizus MCA 3950]KAG7449533.1 hypothetical protein BT62DRAFT_590145 [Guyanagaster necrorhizus MCA 3950]
MHSLPYPLVPLISASLGVSTLTLIFVLVALINAGVNPILWIFPASYALTVPYYAIMLITAYFEFRGSSRLLSIYSIVSAFVCALLWTSCSVCLLTITIMEGKEDTEVGGLRKDTWLLIVPCVSCPVPASLMWIIAEVMRRERKKILYALKWRPVAPQSSQTWSVSLSSVNRI